MDMDDLSEIQLRIAKIEEGLNEVKALVQQAAAKQSPAPAPPPNQAPRQNPVFPSLRVGPAPTPPPTPAQQLWQQPPPATPPPPPFPARPSFVNPPKRRKREVPLRVPTPPPAAAVAPARNAATSPPYEPPPPAPSPLRSGEFEANMLGSWFARIGAFAIFLGAAFAFKYAVDRDLISPAGRIAIGVLLGAAFIGWGEWARRKTWPLFAQAVAGGGVAIMYLSVWAGYQLYDLMSPALALIFLAAVVVLGGALAVRHNSMALAIMAALGGFLNPILVSTGRGSIAALNLYLLFLNAGILGLAFYKRWRSLTVVAMAATWLLVLGSIFDTTQSERMTLLAFGTVFFLIFTAALFVTYLKSEVPAQPEDLVLGSVNALVYFAFGMLVVPEQGQPVFALFLGLFLTGMGLGWRSIHRTDTNAVLTFVGLGVGAVTVAVALQFEGSILATVWAVEAVLIMFASARAELSKLRIAGLVVFCLSVGLSLLGSGLGALYEPPRPIFSVDALPFITQVAALGGTAVLLRRKGETAVEQRAADTVAILALLLNLVWLSFEITAQYRRAGWDLQTFPSTISAFWAVYAAGIGFFGLHRELKWSRPLAGGIFGFSVAISVIASGFGSTYEPIRPMLSTEALAFVLQIVILGSAAVLLRRTASSVNEGRAADAAAVSANLLALLWLSCELWAVYQRPTGDWSFATFTFTLSTVWTLYAAGLLAYGIGRRARWARLFSVSLFGLVIAKLVLADVWLLETPLRIASLMGLGLVLLLCSLGYHRFRALILGPDDPTPPAASSANAA
ncbi:MAG TPA: DUF2339 domain-containing protein [Actinomycetota bacterium]|nr:DUF2339 domain-containing protein [Actinomycetota bacterium]